MLQNLKSALTLSIPSKIVQLFVATKGYLTNKPNAHFRNEWKPRAVWNYVLFMIYSIYGLNGKIVPAHRHTL